MSTPRPSGGPPYFSRGEQISWHYRRPGWRPGDSEFVMPVTVVQDDADALVAWLPAGTPYLAARLADGGDLRSGDHVLDVWVEPDRSHRRKDEHELVEAVRQGRYTPEQAARIEQDAADAEAVVDAWGSPFCDGWERFRPDPAWAVPALPEALARP